VREPADFYRLGVADLEALERLGRKSAQNLVDAVNAARTLPLPRFLRALGIASLGAVAAEKLAETFRTLEAVRAATVEAVAAVFGLGELTAGQILHGLEARRDLIDGLLAVGVTVEAWTPPAAVAVAADSAIAGKSFVFTGKLAAMDRKTAQDRVKALGGQTPAKVSKTLDYLVVGDDGSPLLGGGALSSKHKEAEKLLREGAAVQIITETRFRELAGLD